ncbi:MAG TPA: hypothetical protein VJ742_13180 [Nitrososphaera sp.]|nr:hypothetical protein [Nitrososphaera sp.]
MPVGKPAIVPRTQNQTLRVDPAKIYPSFAELKEAFPNLPEYPSTSVRRFPVADEIEGFYFPSEEITKHFNLEDPKIRMSVHRKMKPLIHRYLGVPDSQRITLRILTEPGNNKLTLWVFRVEGKQVDPEPRVADKPHPLELGAT